MHTHVEYERLEESNRKLEAQIEAQRRTIEDLRTSFKGGHHTDADRCAIVLSFSKGDEKQFGLCVLGFDVLE